MEGTQREGGGTRIVERSGRKLQGGTKVGRCQGEMCFGVKAGLGKYLGGWQNGVLFGGKNSGGVRHVYKEGTRKEGRWADRKRIYKKYYDYEGTAGRWIRSHKNIRRTAGGGLRGGGAMKGGLEKRVVSQGLCNS